MRGQALVEYSVLQLVLVLALLGLTQVKLLPGASAEGPRRSVLQLFSDGWQAYVDSHQTLLSLPYP